jgi:hypothetical protein
MDAIAATVAAFDSYLRRAGDADLIGYLTDEERAEAARLAADAALHFANPTRDSDAVDEHDRENVDARS